MKLPLHLAGSDKSPVSQASAVDFEHYSRHSSFCEENNNSSIQSIHEIRPTAENKPNKDQKEMGPAFSGQITSSRIFKFSYKPNQQLTRKSKTPRTSETLL
jgi:hypothetical protein